MKLVVDTGALLSIACSNYFERILKEHTILVTSEVVSELKRFAWYNDFLGRKASEIISKNLLVKNPSKVVVINLDKAEESVFGLAKEQKCLAITDDVHAARIAHEKLRLETKPSFYLLLILYKKKQLTKDEFVDDINSILKYRNWLSGTLWEYAARLIEQN